jgi:FdhE protein
MKCNPTKDEILAALTDLEQEMSHLEPLTTASRAFVELEASTDEIPLPVEFIASEIPALLQEGVPLLQRGEMLVYPEPMARVWDQVCELAAHHISDKGELLEEYRAWPEEDASGWQGTMAQYYRDGEIETADDRDLLTFLLVHTWRPFLLKWAAALAPLLEEKAWRQNRCPICGGQPDFAYLGAEAGERHLVCSRCDTSWLYHRLGCPFCGTRDAAEYGYYPGEHEIYRLYACNSCQRYLKTIDMRVVIAERLLPVERIATAPMDVSALQNGYRST